MSEAAADVETLGPNVSPRSASAIGLAAIVVAILTFSSSSSIVRLADAPATAVAFWRMVVATLLWHGWMAVRGIRITAAQWRRAALPGICFGVNITLFFTALSTTSIAHTEFIGGLAPLLVVPVGAKLFGERVARKALAWAAVAIAGLALVLFNGPPSNSATLEGDAITLLAVGTWTAYILLTKMNRGDMDVTRFMGAITPIALVAIAPLAIARGDVLDFPAHGWLSIAILGLTTGVLGHGLIVFAQHHVPVAMISIMQVAQPALAVGCAFVLVGERVDTWQVVGGAIVVVSLALFVITARRIATTERRDEAESSIVPASSHPAMQQLSGMDVTFLNMETATTFGHVASLNLFDATQVAGTDVLETTKRIFLDRIGMLAPLRRRLVEVPLGLDQPYWVDDPHFDIDFHVRHHAVAPPGTPHQLSDAISRIHARPLDRSRPLWELYVIEGIDEGRTFATFTKVHHATVDGAAGAMMLASLLDVSPDPAPIEPVPWTAEAIPTDQQLLQRTLIEYMKRPEKAVRLTSRALRELAASTQNGGIRTLASIIAQPMPGPLGAFMRRRLRGVDHEIDDPPHLPPTAAPRTPWNAAIGAHRRFAYTTLSLEDARSIRRALGCTFNDVVMALVSGVLRRYLDQHGVLPEESLVAGVPISVRSGDEVDQYQNRVSMLIADLATNEPDPLVRLARIRASMDKAKSAFRTIPAETLQDFTQFAPPAIAARAMRMASRLRILDRTAPPFNLIISNVPGPNYPLYSGGAELKHFYPVSIVTDSQGLNVTVQSYNGSLDFGFIADRDLVPDVWLMTDLIHESMDELLALT